MNEKLFVIVLFAHLIFCWKMKKVIIMFSNNENVNFPKETVVRYILSGFRVVSLNFVKVKKVALVY